VKTAVLASEGWERKRNGGCHWIRRQLRLRTKIKRALSQLLFSSKCVLETKGKRHVMD
jgi:hypothetical protein